MGLKSSSEVFQREMVMHFGDIQGVEIVVDDILVHGRTLEEHKSFAKSATKGKSYQSELNKEKCIFGASEVNYIGHRLTGDGLKPNQKRVEAIVNMKAPENLGELETVLGMLAYVSKFIPNLSTLNAPLRELKKNPTWEWSTEADQAFKTIKLTLASSQVLK